MHELTRTLGSHAIDTESLERLNASEKEPIYYLPVRGADALALWRTLQALVEQTGYWPVLLGDDEDLEFHRDALEDESFPPTTEILEAAQAIDAQTWLKNNLDTYYEVEEDFTVDDLQGEWPSDVEPNHEFAIPYDYRTRTPLPIVYVALIPTTISWQAPAFVRFGSWNYCPKPEEHVSVLQRWEQLYGAEIVGITHDIIELHVAQPPRERAQALALAYEQFAYCPDIVEQGVGTLRALAVSLLNASVWFFWWD
jgi:hypothetical protein